jgi:hypothetical protein
MSRKRIMVGFGLDSDGHTRITRGDNFSLFGGSEATHEQMQEHIIRVNEVLAKKGLSLDKVPVPHLADIHCEVAERMG